MISMIAAVSNNGVIGLDNALPFNYPEDMKYFRTITAGGNMIFGRKTFESIGRALPKRRNIVISSQKVNVENVETFPTISEALAKIEANIKDALATFSSHEFLVIPPTTWFAGGARIYEEGMQYAEEIHLTMTPDVITRPDAVRFPFINPRMFEIKEWRRLNLESDDLRLYIYKKILN